jgi:hypothetical protein
LRVTDSAGLSGEASFQFVVVHDSSRRSIFGAGWINSQAGWCTLDPACQSAAGQANFGFNVKTSSGSAIPAGSAEFSLGDVFQFHSEALDSLVFGPDGKSAQLSGRGRIQGASAPPDRVYQFTIWMTDGRPDTFRIRIWWVEAGLERVVYDTAGVQQPLGAGNLIVRR